jgi:3-hydroxyisobutyrate dehydrogenase-like beta-hydroxyacid dehydrogenase
VLDTYAHRIVQLGPTEAGAAMKLMLMTPIAIYFAGLAEWLAMGGQLGLDRAAMLDVILDSHGAPPVLRDRADLVPAGSLIRAGQAAFSLVKLLARIRALARRGGVERPCAVAGRRVTACRDGAGIGSGHGARGGLRRDADNGSSSH